MAKDDASASDRRYAIDITISLRASCEPDAWERANAIADAIAREHGDVEVEHVSDGEPWA